MHIIADNDAAGYVVREDAKFPSTDTTCSFGPGDNIQAVIAKINESGAGVKAKLDPVKNSLVLQTTSPHQLWIEDIGEGTVMQDLGILSGRSDLPPAQFRPGCNGFRRFDVRPGNVYSGPSLRRRQL